MIKHGFCYFCHQALLKTDIRHAFNEYVFKCTNCQTETEHMFYCPSGTLHLTLRTILKINSKEYILYLYPTYQPAVLLQLFTNNENRPKEIIKLHSMKDFTAHNLKQQVERILNLKAFL